MKNILLILVVPVAFLIIGIYTLPDYGINWDEPKHFARGQAYFHYILTGQKNYQKIPALPMLNGAYDSRIEYEAVKSSIPPDPSYRRSYYQSDVYTLEFLLDNPLNIPDLHGHPEGNDLLAAIFNKVFYQEFNIFGDIESYHLFEIFVSSLLVAAVSLFTYKHLGVFPSVVAGASLALYPLFWAESHFNIKDPPVTSFYGLTIILFYFGVLKQNRKLLLCSAVAAGFAFSTKLNAVFMLPILASWLIFFQKKSIKKNILGFTLLPIVAFATFYLSWPLLWFSPIERITSMLNFYQKIGTSSGAQWNLYPITWITFTTPIPILVLGSIGVAYSILNINKKNGFYFVTLSWLLITIFRVSVPGTNIYGGVRQLMEFIPALAILCGIGAHAIISSSIAKQVTKSVIAFSLCLILFENISLHPNQNIYFNQLIGDLSGAKEVGLDSWGNSFGNAYQQGISWLNENAEGNAKLALAVGNTINAPRVKLREDIDFNNSHWSGPQRKGEYVMELYFDWDPLELYAYQYYDNYLNPVYEVKVDGVPILKIWKNDLAHTKRGYQSESIYNPSSIKPEDGKILLDYDNEFWLTKIEIVHSAQGCDSQTGGYIATSLDKTNWTQHKERIDGPQMRIDPEVYGIDENKMVYFLPAVNTKHIMIDTLNPDSCYLKDFSLDIHGLKQ